MSEALSAQGYANLGVKGSGFLHGVQSEHGLKFEEPTPMCRLVKFFNISTDLKDSR